MAAPVTTLPKSRPESASAVCIACVVAAENGEALLVRVDDHETPIPVRAHLRGASGIVAGDAVLVQFANGLAVVIDRLRGAGEAPSAHVADDQGQITLTASRGISLVVGESRIELGADGELRLNGKRILQHASERCVLRSPIIKIN